MIECPYCGSSNLIRVNCKVICGDCRGIIETCGD